MKKKLFQAAPVLVVAVLLIFWEAVVQIAQIPLYVLPAPSDMLKTFVTEFPVLAGHAGITVMEAFVGMGISFVVGVLIGILMDALPLVRRFYNLGFNIEATEGTARFLKEKLDMQ